MKNYLHSCFIILALLFPEIVFAKINIVTTIKPIQALIKSVTDGVENAEGKKDKENYIKVDLLLDKKSSPHHYFLKPSDMNKLHKADVIFYVSRDLETFMNKLVNSDKLKDKQLVELAQSSGLILLNQQQKLDNIRSNFKYNIDKKDPHIWLSPENSKRILQIVADVMCEYDMKNADQYQHNADKAIEAINNMDHKISYLMNEVKNEPFIIYHDGYQYFTKHYNLNSKAVLSSEDHNMSAAGLNKLSKLVRESKIKCVFGEARSPNQFLKTAIGRNAKIGYLDAEWGVNHPQAYRKDSEAYIIMMQNVADNIYMCLKNSVINTIPNK